MLLISTSIRFLVVFLGLGAAGVAAGGEADWLTAAPGTAPLAHEPHPPMAAPAPVRAVAVIRAPENAADQRVVYPYTVAQPVYREPYPYGYFGAKPHHHRHPHRSFGHRRAYTQWRWQ